jgi:hypothetical protein
MQQMLKILLVINLIRAECPFNATSNNQIVIIKNFNNLSELSFNQCKETIKLSHWGLKPNKKLILDNTLKLKGLKILTDDSIIHIQLINFKGLDLVFNPFDDINISGYSFENIGFVLEQFNFDLFINNKLITEKECFSNKNWNNFISKSNYLSFSAYYSLKTCPYVFKNTKIFTSIFNNIRSSFVDSNILSFIKLNNSNNDLNSDIFHTEFVIYRTQFDENLFNKDIFKKTKSLFLYGIINNIKDDLFKLFNNLKLVQIYTQNVRQLFSKNIKWFMNLNFNLESVNLDDLLIIDQKMSLLKKSIYLKIFQTFPRVTFYDYPNEDFCLFSKFPHNQLVFPLLKPNHNSTCSCTEIYLIQYSFRINFVINFYTYQIITTLHMFQYYTDDLLDNSFSNCAGNMKELENLVKICDFKKRLEKCNIQSRNNKQEDNKKTYFEMYDWEQVRRISVLIFSVYINNIFSLIILILNILTVKILGSKTVKATEKNPMYNFLYLNTIMSMIYVLICLFKTIGICVDKDFYCSPLNETKFNIFYNTIFVLFIGETFKTVSNFSFISFSISRYLLVTSSKSSFLLKLNKLKKFNYFLISIIIAVIMNLYHLFEYNFTISKPTNFFDSLSNFDSFFKYSNPNDLFIEHFSTFQFYLLNTFYYIKIIFSDLSYIIFNLIIDLKLLSFIKIQNAKRLKLADSNNLSNINQANSSSSRLISMIILNGLNCFIFRFPSAFASFYGFIFRYDKKDKIYKPNVPGYIICHSFKICPNIQEILYFFYLFSILLQFFIFLKFDKIFLKGYIEIKNNFSKRFKRQ